LEPKINICTGQNVLNILIEQKFEMFTEMLEILNKCHRKDTMLLSNILKHP